MYLFCVLRFKSCKVDIVWATGRPHAQLAGERWATSNNTEVHIKHVFNVGCSDRWRKAAFCQSHMHPGLTETHSNSISLNSAASTRDYSGSVILRSKRQCSLVVHIVIEYSKVQFAVSSIPPCPFTPGLLNGLRMVNVCVIGAKKCNGINAELLYASNHCTNQPVKCHLWKLQSCCGL